jgi:hypothetical protein
MASATNASYPGMYPGMAPPPPGETANLKNPESIAWRLILTSVLCPVVGLIFVVLRLYTGRYYVRKLFADDGMIVAALVRLWRTWVHVSAMLSIGSK